MDNSIKSLQTQDLLQAKYTEGTQALTKNQKSSLLFIYAKILQHIKHSGEKEWYSISIDEMMDHLDGSKGGNQARLVWDQLKDLNQTQISIPYVSDGELRERLTHVVSEVDRPITASGDFKVKISDLVLKNIQYREGIIYRWIDLKYARSLSSPKHMDLYEILKASENMDHWKVSLQDLKAMVNLHNNYPAFSQFKKWFLTPATIDISKNTDLKVSWKENRGKRNAVESITFKIKKESTKKTVIVETEPSSNIHIELKSRGVMNSESFDIDDRFWKEAIKLEPADSAPSHLITTARRLKNEEVATRDKLNKTESESQRIKIHEQHWVNNKYSYSSDLIQSGSYLQHRITGEIFLFVDESFIKNIDKYKTSTTNQREVNLFVESMKVMKGGRLQMNIVNRINEKKDEGVYTNWSTDDIRHKGTNPENISGFLVGRAYKENPLVLQNIFDDVYGAGWETEAKERLAKKGIQV